MNLKINARNIDIDSASSQYIQKKFARLERHLRNLSDAKLEVHRTSSRAQSDRIVAQMTLSAGSRVLRGQERALNLFAAIDAFTDVMTARYAGTRASPTGPSRPRRRASLTRPQTRAANRRPAP